MRCLACGTEMLLAQAVPDDTAMVPGYEHQTHECPACREVETRFFFKREATDPPSALPAAPTPNSKTESAYSVLEQAVERLCQRTTGSEQRSTRQQFGDMTRFDEYWETLIPRLPSASMMEPLARSVSLVPVERQRPPGEDLSTWVRQMLADDQQEVHHELLAAGGER